jgi:hypothetical protein
MVGEVRRTISLGRQSQGLVKQLGLDFLGNPAFSQVLAPRALRAAAGVRFNAVIGNGATFLAPVTAYPTTTLTMALWNGEPDGGKSYFIDKVYAFLASGTPDVGGALLACVTKERQTAPTLSTGDNGGYAGTKIGGLSGKLPGASKAVFINAITALSAPVWFVADSKPQVTATAKVAAAAFEGNLEGGVVIPPGFMLGLAVLAGAGTNPLFGLGVTWDEIQADLE